jgi:predicted ATPase/class 3 adenylate cyclase
MIAPMGSDLPTGNVTFLFTDVEGSTRLLGELGSGQYGALLAEHHRVCREAWDANGGVEFGTAGDAFFVAFARPSDALAAAATAQRALAELGVAVRMGVHTGDVELGETGYVGLEIHRAARITASGHGGQVLVSAATAALVDAPLMDLGEHRFRDLSAPEHVFQFGEGEFPRLNSLYRSNLPVPATPFLGREEELAAVVGMLSEPETRLVSLTGPGGTGKTRLALQAVAQASERFVDGVYWVPLAPLRDSGLVLAELATALGVREGATNGSIVNDLTARLAGKSMLVLLDNAEQLMPAVADDVGGLLDSCPSITVAVTSRERLQLPGERIFAVPPMSATDGEALFRRRATDAGVELADSDELGTLCARLDNLPLALELAAARTVLFTPAQLLVRLSNRLDLLKGGRGIDPRQETLRATIDWSHDLLDPGEQQLFRRLSVFADGCTYESAEEVASAQPDALQSLLDKSLLRRRDATRGPRFWMLETLREYAAEQLGAAGEADEFKRRHLDHFAAIADASYDETWSGVVDLTLIEEWENIRVALDCALETDPGTALVLATQFSGYWLTRGGIREGREKLAEALTRTPAEATHSRALAILVLGTLASAQRDFASADECCLEAHSLFRALGERSFEGRSLIWLGDSAYRRGDLDAATRYIDEALEALDAAGDETWHRRAVSILAWAHSARGDHSRALAIQRDVIDLVRRDQSAMTLAMCLTSLAELERVAGEEAQARLTLDESIGIMRDLGQRRFLGGALVALGFALRQSAPTEALTAFSEALEIARETDYPTLAAACFEGAASVFAEGVDPEHAASLLGAAATIRARVPADPQEQADAEAAEALCRKALPPDEFARAWEYGAALDADTAIDSALRAWKTHLG